MPNEYTLGGPPPQSRSEKILMKQNPGPAQSRIEELLKNASGRTSGALIYKGTAETTMSLPSSGNEVGDVYHVKSDGSEWAWNGEQWEELGTAVDLSGYRTASAQDAIDSAQDTAIAAKYTKPSTGIPKTDLASDVKTSLGKADTAVQPSAISDMATQTYVQTQIAAIPDELPAVAAADNGKFLRVVSGAWAAAAIPAAESNSF